MLYHTLSSKIKIFFSTAFVSAIFLLSAQHIGYLMPSGGKAGTTAEVLVGGQQLWSVNQIRFSGPDAAKKFTVESVTLVPGLPPIGGNQRKFVVQWMRNILAGKKEIPPKNYDQRELDSWRKHIYFNTVDQLTPLQFHILGESIFLPRNSLQMSPAINSLAILRFKIAPDTKPGRYELRLQRKNAMLSNPLPFYVDTLPEKREPYFKLPPGKPEIPSFTIPAVINGQILPGATDSWNFTAKKGDTITFQTFARKLIPYMGDCVPGYFQCLLELYDAKGKQLVSADDFHSDPDPVLTYQIPEDGQYELRIRDALYRGRADFVYRIRCFKGTLPFKLKAAPRYPELPEIKTSQLEKGKQTDYPVMLQGVVTGQNAKEHFKINVRKDEKIVLEVFARRLGSPLDSRLTVTAPDGKKIAFNDDYPRIKVGTVMQDTDSYLMFTAPQSGIYTVELADTAGKHGKHYQYFLRIDRPRPSFRLFVKPSSIPVPQNGNVAVKIMVEPQDGFSNDIVLDLKAPNRYTLTGSRIIPAGTTETTITMSCTQDRKRDNVRAILTGTSADGTFSTRAIPGDETMQAFAYTHILPAMELLLHKTWTPAGATLIAPANPGKTLLKADQNHTAVLTLKQKKLTAYLKNGKYEFSLPDSQKQVRLEKVRKVEKKGKQAEYQLTFKAVPDEKNSSGKIRTTLLIKTIFTYETKNKEGKTVQRKSTFYLPVLMFTAGE